MRKRRKRKHPTASSMDMFKDIYIPKQPRPLYLLLGYYSEQVEELTGEKVHVTQWLVERVQAIMRECKDKEKQKEYVDELIRKQMR